MQHMHRACRSTGVVQEGPGLLAVYRHAVEVLDLATALGASVAGTVAAAAAAALALPLPLSAPAAAALPLPLGLACICFRYLQAEQKPEKQHEYVTAEQNLLTGRPCQSTPAAQMAVGRLQCSEGHMVWLQNAAQAQACAVTVLRSCQSQGHGQVPCSIVDSACSFNSNSKLGPIPKSTLDRQTPLPSSHLSCA